LSVAWSRLNHLQLGKYAEYFIKMEFVLLGCDVFTSEVDNHGIDFVVRTPVGNHYDVQVKSFRSQPSKGTPYVFLQKSKFRDHPALLLALIHFVDGELPNLFLVRSRTTEGMNPIFESRDYEGKKSEPEWGLTMSKKKLAALAKDWGFQDVVAQLKLHASP
jgi:hypothetical protein